FTGVFTPLPVVEPPSVVAAFFFFLVVLVVVFSTVFVVLLVDALGVGVDVSPAQPRLSTGRIAITATSARETNLRNKLIGKILWNGQQAGACAALDIGVFEDD